MILSNRKWSVNLTKESLLKEIDDEIQKEYQILNKYSSEKFSIILIIFGILTLIATLWSFISSTIIEKQFLLYYLISANILILNWCYSEKIINVIKFILKIPNKNVPKSEKNVDSLNPLQLINSLDDRAQFRILLNMDWDIAKKGEPYFKSFSIFLFTLLAIAFANSQNWITIPFLNSPIAFGITVESGLIIYSLIIIICTFNPNIITIFWEKMFKWGKSNKSFALSWTELIKLVFYIILGVLIILFWEFFFYVFPLLMLGFFVFPNIPLFFANLYGNVVGLVILTMILYLLVEFLALLFGINLVESIKNEKIWWLETLKIDLNSISDVVDGKKQLEIFYKKFDCSDLYIPVPIQRFFTFQKYVFFPKWIMKPAIDIETCNDDDFEILKERFNFQRNLIYRQNEQ